MHHYVGTHADSWPSSLTKLTFLRTTGYTYGGFTNVGDNVVHLCRQVRILTYEPFSGWPSACNCIYCESFVFDGSTML